MPNIAVINESTAIADDRVKAMLPALQTQWNRDLQPMWGVEEAGLVFVPKGIAPASGLWWSVFLDDSDQAGALAYHDLTNEGLPIAKTFVKTLLADGASISVGVSHEHCEMAVDSDINGAVQDDAGTFWANEICDAVESDQYGYDIEGTRVSNFILRPWYKPAHSRGPYDFRGHCRKPFEILAGGYAQVFSTQQRGWVQITGPNALLRSHAAIAAPGSRRERRARSRRTWVRSEVNFARAA